MTTYYLVDQNGNQLVDESSNPLVAIIYEIPVTIMSHGTDTMFHAYKSISELVSSLRSYSLVDQNSNPLTDESGNYLTANLPTTVSILSRPAQPTNTTFHAE